MIRRRAIFTFVMLLPAASFAQSNQSPSLVLPTVIVTAQKEASDIKDVPASVTAVTTEMIRESDFRSITDASIFSPNTVFTELTARRMSSARFRGIGSSLVNPAVTTYLDGVPQLNSSSSNIELLDVSQIEFVRGPQSALFGRNTLGGIVNVTSARPSLSRWSGTVMAPFGSAGAMEVRGNMSGPLTDKVAIGFAGGKQQRDGYTRNAVTGDTLDSRDGTFAKAQLFMQPSANWDARVIYAYERDRDGADALGDLSAIRIAPFRVNRNFEGFSNRDINNLTVHLHGIGENVSIESITGVIKWKVEDQTDLDYSPLPLATGVNAEEARQFTQQVRLSSPDNAPLPIGSMMLKWQAGLEFFHQDYEQDVVNSLSAFVWSPSTAVPVEAHTPGGSIDSTGVGIYGRATLAITEKSDVTAGLRFDHESNDAALNTFYVPAVSPSNFVNSKNSFSNVSSQFAFGYRATPHITTYAALGSGFKAGGFNTMSPAGSEAYGEEHAWQFEAGAKSTLAEGKLAVNGAFFLISWDDLQLGLADPSTPGQFYTSNAGDAGSRGMEVEITARPRADLDLFGTWGFASALFADGTMAGGVNIGHNKLPYSPGFTASIGGEFRRAITAAINGYGRAEIALLGDFRYDEANTQGQNAYSVVNLRGGARYKWIIGELWLRNALDTHYVPIALPSAFAPTGFIGENGRPRTFGISVGATF